jgi:DedD protein
MAQAKPQDAADESLKRRARRRLMGAIALVLAAIIVLPMVFDAEKKAPSQDIAITIPNQESVTVKPIAGGAKDLGKDGAKDVSKESAKDTPKESAKAEAKGDAKADVKSEAKSEGKSEPAPKAAEKAAPKAETKAESKPDTKSEEAKALAILNAQDGKKAAEKSAAKSAEKAADKSADKAAANGAFAVQIGAFATDEKVREARDKLSAAGFKSFTESVETKDGARTRVRAGPFASRVAAEAARDSIRPLGFAGAAVVER